MLTRDAIIDAGLAIVDENGPDRLTMRGLAERLGVTATAIYHYFDGRDALLAAIRDRVGTGVVAGAGVDGEWRHRLDELLHSLIERSWAHPAASVWAITADARQEPMLRLHESILEILHGAGFPAEDAVQIKGILLRFCIGHLQLRDAAVDREWRKLAKGRYPRLRAAGPALDASRPEDVFTIGLATLLDAFNAREPTIRRRATRR